METKWSSLVSYGLTVEALTDFLPLDVTLDVKTVRHDTLKVAERCGAVAPQLTVVSAPLRYEAFQRMRGTPTLLGWGPASRWDMKR